MKVYVVGGAYNYADFIESAELVDSLEDANVVLFTGGEDVDPSIYGCKKHDTTYSNIKRDLKEKAIFEKVNPKTQICVGICRGSQLMCALNGGILVQDCDNHAIGTTHEIKGNDMIYHITSTHHQMQYPFYLNKEDYDLLYISEDLASFYEGDKIDINKLYEYGEPEVVLYHKEGLPKCLAIQGHPEMIPNSPVSKMLSNLIKDLIHNDNK